MKKIRYNTFETNSSSTHSLTLGRKIDDYLPIENDLEIRFINTDDETVLTTLKDKVSYLVSHVASWYKYIVENYDDLIRNIKEDYDYKELERFVYEKYGKKIVFPKEYDGYIEDIVEINHQLMSYNHSLEDVIRDMIESETYLFNEVLSNGKDIEFGRD